jgi:[amino group carrier protein]-lysine/ornithine hydrolase
MTKEAPTDAAADDLLTGLVLRYSPSMYEGDAVDYLVQWMNAHGFDANVDAAGNAVGVIGQGERTLLLLGHIDTVSGFIAVRRDAAGDGGKSVAGRLYGRGTVDAKGPLAAFAAAAARVGEQAGKRIIVVGAVEEEAATSKGARFLLDQLTPDAVVIGEPSGWDRLTVGYKGRLLVDYRLSRAIGHTAGPDDGVCEEAFAFWAAVKAYSAEANLERSRVFDQLLPSLRTMHAEDDGFQETATLTVGFRLPEGTDVDALRADLLRLGRGARVTFRGQEPAYRAAKNTPLARAFIQAIEEEGARAQFKVKSGTSDMNVVGPVWNCPILAYGPGDSSLDHTPNEHIELDEYHRAIAVLTRVITRI